MVLDGHMERLALACLIKQAAGRKPSPEVSPAPSWSFAPRKNDITDVILPAVVGGGVSAAAGGLYGAGLADKLYYDARRALKHQLRRLRYNVLRDVFRARLKITPPETLRELIASDEALFNAYERAKQMVPRPVSPQVLKYLSMRPWLTGGILGGAGFLGTLGLTGLIRSLSKD